MSPAAAKKINAGDLTEAAMFDALGSILRRGMFDIDDLEVLARFATGINVDSGASCFARQTMDWLTQHIV